MRLHQGTAQLHMTTREPPCNPDGHMARRLLHFLSFLRNGAYMSAMTVYHSTSGITGIAVHFSSSPASVLLGDETIFPLHFALAPGEYVTSAWVGRPGNWRGRLQVTGANPTPHLNGTEVVLAVRYYRLNHFRTNSF